MKTLWTLALVVLLSGCATTQVKVVEYQKLVLTEIEPQLLQDPSVPPPPDPQAFVTMSQDEREDALIRTLLLQYKVIEQATIDKQRLRSLLEQQRAAIETFNAQEADRIARLKAELEKSQ